jgi:hypothetical protein
LDTVNHKNISKKFRESDFLLLTLCY